MNKLVNNKEHRGIVERFNKVLQGKGERVTTERLAQWIFDNFPEYRDQGIEALEMQVTEIIYN